MSQKRIKTHRSKKELERPMDDKLNTVSQLLEPDEDGLSGGCYGCIEAAMGEALKYLKQWNRIKGIMPCVEEE